MSPRPEPHFRSVCRTSDVPLGESRAFWIDETGIAVFHLSDGFFALRNECPHAGASLAHGTMEGDVIRCRVHHWGFCVRDGKYIDEDRPIWDAKALPLRVVDDEIQVAFE